MRGWLVAGVILFAGAASACGDLFSPKGCTQTVYVTDSVQVLQGTDTTWHVDTIARFKLCAQ